MLEINVVKKFHSDAGDIEFRPRLNIAAGTFNMLFGKSGSGKTTLLRMIAGLAEPDAGDISSEGKSWTDKGRVITAPQDRNIGFVSQDFSLFGHMTVEENVYYACGDKKEADRLIEASGLSALRKKHADRLSGGQKQRVAFSRAMARKPGLLLLDEPMSALDGETRCVMRTELKSAAGRGVTIVMVTHDVAEIFALAEKVFVIESGIIAREGTPAEIFINSMTPNKFALTGEVVRVEKNGAVNVVTVSSGESAAEIVVSRFEAAQLHPGDTVLVAAKDFRPVLIKMNRGGLCLKTETRAAGAGIMMTARNS
jgi:molybdate transport system ATP-binding protein